MSRDIINDVVVKKIFKGKDALIWLFTQDGNTLLGGNGHGASPMHATGHVDEGVNIVNIDGQWRLRSSDLWVVNNVLYSASILSVSSLHDNTIDLTIEATIL